MVLSSFHPAVAAWFTERLGEPTPPQREGWPADPRRAPHAHRRADRLGQDARRVPLGHRCAYFGQARPARRDAGPLRLAAARRSPTTSRRTSSARSPRSAAVDPSAPRDPRPRPHRRHARRARAAMSRRPPHILVTTPESLYILLTSDGGRGDAPNGRDGHRRRDPRARPRQARLAISRSRSSASRRSRRRGRCSASASRPRRSPSTRSAASSSAPAATARSSTPGTFRQLDLAIEIPPSPLAAVCSHEQWEEIYARIAELVREHRTTLVFVNTRKMAERIAAQLTRLARRGRRHEPPRQPVEGAPARRRAAAEGRQAARARRDGVARARDRHRRRGPRRSRSGRRARSPRSSSASAARGTASIERPEGPRSSRSRSTSSSRAPRCFAASAPGSSTARRCRRAARHPRAADRGRLRRRGVGRETSSSRSCGGRGPTAISRARTSTRSSPSTREGRRALLHRDGVSGRLTGDAPRAADRAHVGRRDPGHRRLPGAARARGHARRHGQRGLGHRVQRRRHLPARQRVVARPARRARHRPRGRRQGRAADASRSGSARRPGRTRELSARDRRACARCAVATMRSAAPAARCGDGAARRRATRSRSTSTPGSALSERPDAEARRSSSASSTRAAACSSSCTRRSGSKINRAWGLALRKRFCVGFGFELQAAANEEAIVLSLGTAAQLPARRRSSTTCTPTRRGKCSSRRCWRRPLFETRWRWNGAALAAPRAHRGAAREVPAPLLRMRADDLLAAAFPAGHGLPARRCRRATIEVPMDHPIVRQTIEDCLTEAMDVEGFLEVLRGLHDGSIERRAVDTAEPSAFARGILSRPALHVPRRRASRGAAHAGGARPPHARRQAPPTSSAPSTPRRSRASAKRHGRSPTNAEEVHEALLWMGYVTVRRGGVRGRRGSPSSSAAAASCSRRIAGSRPRRRAIRRPSCAAGSRRSGPSSQRDDPLLFELESEGVVLRTRFDGQPGLVQPAPARAHPSLHARPAAQGDRARHGAQIPALPRVLAACRRRSIASRVRAAWPRSSRSSPGFEVPAAGVGGERACRRACAATGASGSTSSRFRARSPGGGSGAAGPGRSAAHPICLVPRDELETWTALSKPPDIALLAGAAREIYDRSLHPRRDVSSGAWSNEPALPSELENGLGELVARGLLTCDSYGGLRWLLVPASRRAVRSPVAGRWSLLRLDSTDAAPARTRSRAQLLRRTGVVFRKTIAREKQPLPWRDLVRVLRTLEARGEVRGGRFVAGFDGEQYALPEAVTLLRAVRRRAPSGARCRRPAADPLNFRGILTPDERVSPLARQKVLVA